MANTWSSYSSEGLIMLPDIPAFAQWLLDLITWIPKKIYELFTDMIVSLIDGFFSVCTVCDFSSIPSSVTSLPAGIIYLASWFHFGLGLSIVTGSYLIRFLIRRLPVIG